MNKAIFPLLIAQFLSAFGDNAILFAVIAMVMHSVDPPSWYVPALQSVFLISFVVLAPLVGVIADRYAKSRVLIVANLIKGLGTLLLLINVEPLLAYALVGAGAAIYSPAKYGILPELAGHRQLVKANSWIEGSTILAILGGMAVGGKLADASVSLALTGTLALYLISALTSWLLPRKVVISVSRGNPLRLFMHEIRDFLALPRSRFSVLGASLFWAAAACVRVVIVAWAPSVLMLHSSSDIANLMLFLALGIIAGSALAPACIPLEHLRRAQWPAYLLGLAIFALSFSETIWTARAILFLMGAAGGLFIVPINASLQEIGQQSIGSGGAVAMQNFFQNVAMLLSVGSYTLAAAQGIAAVTVLWALGAVVIAATFLVAWHLPELAESASRE